MPPRPTRIRACGDTPNTGDSRTSPPKTRPKLRAVLIEELEQLEGRTDLLVKLIRHEGVRLRLPQLRTVWDRHTRRRRKRRFRPTSMGVMWWRKNNPLDSTMRCRFARKQKFTPGKPDLSRNRGRPSQPAGQLGTSDFTKCRYLRAAFSSIPDSQRRWPGCSRSGTTCGAS